MVRPAARARRRRTALTMKPPQGRSPRLVGPRRPQKPMATERQTRQRAPAGYPCAVKGLEVLAAASAVAHSPTGHWGAWAQAARAPQTEG